MKSMIRVFVCFAASALLAGCGSLLLPPVAPEYALLSTDIHAPSSDPAQGKLVIFNNSSKLMFGFDGTGKLNVKLDGKGVAGLQIGQYVQIQVPKGMRQMELMHIDGLAFTSTHPIQVDADLLFIEVEATMVSNAAILHRSLPTGNALPKPFEPLKP